MGQSTKMSNTGLPQQGSVGNGAPPTIMAPAATGGAATVTVSQGNGHKKPRLKKKRTSMRATVPSPRFPTSKTSAAVSCLVAKEGVKSN